jgi:hypothetical protein
MSADPKRLQSYLDGLWEERSVALDARERKLTVWSRWLCFGWILIAVASGIVLTLSAGAAGLLP